MNLEVDAPVVSICLPAYQQAGLVERAVESIFRQDFASFELIVTDDSDSDAVERVLDKWLADPRLKYVRNAVRQGSPANWNKALSMATGKYIKFVHHDDWFAESHSLSRFVSELEENPDAVVAYSSTYACTVDGNVVSAHQSSSEQIRKITSRPMDLVLGNVVGAPSATIFRKTPNFGFDEKLQWVVDIDAYLRLLQGGGRLVHIAEPLMCITMQGEHQVTYQIRNDRVLMTTEHLYLHIRHVKTFAEKLRYLKHVVAVASGVDRSELVVLRNDKLLRDRGWDVSLALSLNRVVAYRRKLIRYLAGRK